MRSLTNNRVWLLCISQRPNQRLLEQNIICLIESASALSVQQAEEKHAHFIARTFFFFLLILLLTPGEVPASSEPNHFSMV